MSVRNHRALRASILGGTALVAVGGFSGNGSAQEQLPNVVVEAPKQVAGAPKQKPKSTRIPRAVAQRAAFPSTVPPTPVSPAAQLAAKGVAFDQARSRIFTTTGIGGKDAGSHLHRSRASSNWSTRKLSGVFNWLSVSLSRLPSDFSPCLS